MKPSYASTAHDRRCFFKNMAALVAAPVGASLMSASASSEQHPPDGAEQLTHYQEAEMGGTQRGPHIWLRWNNEPLVSYRAHPTQKYPYFYPLIGLASGLSVTAETALPWPHHRSLYFAVDRLNGGNYWQAGLEHGQIKSSGPQVLESTKNSAVIRDACTWSVQDGPAQASDKRTYTITVDYPRQWTLETEIVWTAIENMIIEKTNHGLFAVRCAIDLSPWGGGALLSSEGNVGEERSFGKPARWCAFYGKRRQGAGPMEGIALFDHPDNPWNPCPWFTRDYGFISPMPFQWLEKPWELDAGKSVTLKYKIVVFSGDPQEAALDGQYTDWLKG